MYQAAKTARDCFVIHLEATKEGMSEVVGVFFTIFHSILTDAFWPFNELTTPRIVCVGNCQQPKV
jgi:hypothetical protein